MHEGGRSRPAVDAGVAALLFAVAAMTAGLGRDRFPVVGLFLAAAACAATIGRQRWPQAAFLVSAVCAEAALATWGSDAGILVLAAPLVCLYAFALASGWRRGAIVGGAVLAVIFGLHATVQPLWAGPQNVALLGFGGFALAAGEAGRSRRAFAAAMEERAHQAEVNLGREAERRVTQDRLRIARDLHDLLGHQLALISVHSGAAADVLDAQPDDARTSLRHIKVASRTALDDLRDVVMLLRSPDEITPAATTPADRLARLNDLFAAFARSGLDVDAAVGRPNGPVPANIDLTVYRVVQESLTNVVKHAPGRSAWVQISYGSHELRVEVVNDGPLTEDAPPGHGLMGMRERVALTGGRLVAGPRAAGGFRVCACFPLPGSDHDP